jgi:hypothetical protein
LVITADSEDGSFDFFAQTNEKADDSYDAYDLEIPHFPEGTKKLYSSVLDKELIMDSWNMDEQSSVRYLNLVFEKSDSLEEELNLSFSGTISSVYNLVLYDYGNDSDMEDLVGWSSISSGEYYPTEINSELSYFKLKVDYLYCGDSTCSAGIGETCNNCQEDCGACETVNDGGGGGGGLTTKSVSNQTVALEVNELREGVKKTLNVDSIVRFKFLNYAHTLKVASISQKRARIIISSEPIHIDINEGETKEVDVDGDSISDLEINAESITDEIILFIKAIDIERFSEVGLEELIEEPEEKISIFDKRYRESQGFSTLRIVVSIAVLFIGASIFIFGLFLLFKRNKENREENLEERYVKPGA